MIKHYHPMVTAQSKDSTLIHGLTSRDWVSLCLVVLLLHLSMVETQDQLVALPCLE